MLNRTVQNMVLTALFIALVTLATMVIHVPMPGAAGFVNVGDTMIFVAAATLGPRVGMAAGGLGSALADILLGYAYWSPWTLVIKGLEGLICGVIARPKSRSLGQRFGVPLAVLGSAVAAVWMVGAYTVATAIIADRAAAIGALPGNTIQGVASVIIATPLLYGAARLRLYRRT